MQQIYFDLTELIHASLTIPRITGIQRVVLMTAKALQKKHPKTKFFFRHPFDRKFYIFDEIDLEKFNDLHDFYPISRHWRIGSLKFSLTKRTIKESKKITTAIKAIVQFTAANLLKHCEAKVLHTKNNISFRIFFATPNQPVTFLEFAIIDPDKYKSFFKTFSNARFVFFIHDIIPLTHPHLVNYKEVNLFKKYTPFVVENANLILTSSKYNIFTLNTWIKNKKYSTNIRAIEAIPLPCDLPSYSENQPLKDIREEIRFLKEYRYCLCVGSVGIRKNHFSLIQAWLKFWNSNKYNNELLVIAGTSSFSLIENILKNHPAAGSILLLSNINEKELAFLYENCRFTAYPSLLEGWGLPISESIGFGKPVILINASSTPEASFGVGTIVQKDSLNEMLKAIEELFGNVNYYNICIDKIKNKQNILPTWEQFSERVFSLIQDIN